MRRVSAPWASIPGAHREKRAVGAIQKQKSASTGELLREKRHSESGGERAFPPKAVVELPLSNGRIPALCGRSGDAAQSLRYPMCGRRFAGKGFFRSCKARSVRPCVRPVDAARAPLAFMLSADQIPIKNTRSMALWDYWVRLVPGATGLA